MDDDFNAARALGVVFELVRETHRRVAEGADGAESARVPAAAAAAVAGMLEVLGIPTRPRERQQPPPEQALELLEKRNAARAARDWAAADALRDELAALGFTVEDRAEGSVLKRTAP
jgi:cysteinyl-tRNA synthetase